MSALYSHAQRWEWMTTNPITHVRQSAKRSRIPTVSRSAATARTSLANLADPAKDGGAAGCIDRLACRRTAGPEVVGHRFRTAWRSVSVRDVVKQRIERCKTEASKKPVPIDAELAEALWSWRLRCAYNEQHDWVFASPHRKGKQPYWPSSLYRVVLKPALRGCWHHRAGRLAHPAAQLRNADEGERRRREDDSGTSSSCQLQGDDGRVYAGCDGGEADCAQSCGAADHGTESRQKDDE